MMWIELQSAHLEDILSTCGDIMKLLDGKIGTWSAATINFQKVETGIFNLALRIRDLTVSNLRYGPVVSQEPEHTLVLGLCRI